MIDLFDARAAKPMMIGESVDPFDDADSIFELKLDGVRLLAYLDGSRTLLMNKLDQNILYRFPELSEMHKQVDKRCILDGEMIVMRDGRPDWDIVKNRSLSGRGLRAQVAADQTPATFVVFDILYLDDAEIVNQPLMERKALLEETVRENERLTLSRYIEKEGIAFFQAATAQQLEGIVAKRKDSLYQMGKRTRDWVKIKNRQDDEFVICGYIMQKKNIASLILAQHAPDGKLVYVAHATIALSNPDFDLVLAVPKCDNAPIDSAIPEGNEGAVWIEPKLVCTVHFADRNESGSLRQPFYKGMRTDKTPDEAVLPTSHGNQV